MKKFCISQVSVVTFSGGMDKVDYSLFFLSNTTKMTFFGLFKVKWLHLTGEMDKSVRFSNQFFFQKLTYQKSLKSLSFDRVIKK